MKTWSHISGILFCVFSAEYNSNHAVDSAMRAIILQTSLNVKNNVSVKSFRDIQQISRIQYTVIQRHYAKKQSRLIMYIGFASEH